MEHPVSFNVNNEPAKAALWPGRADEAYGEKERIRSAMKRKIESLPSHEKKCLERKILGRVLRLKKYLRAKKIAIFLYDGRFNTTPLIERAFADGKKILVMSYGPMKCTVFYRITSLDDLKFGPRKTYLFNCTRRLRQASFDLLFSPCLAFTRQGFLVGYGHGERDRYFERRLSVRTKEICLAYSFQEISKFPIQRTDVRASCIVTEKGIYRAGGIKKKAAITGVTL